jgi:hypothetical protein
MQGWGRTACKRPKHLKAASLPEELLRATFLLACLAALERESIRLEDIWTRWFVIMAKSRRRKPKKSQPRSSPAETAQQTLPRSYLSTFVRRILDHPVVVALGLLASLIAIGDFVWDALQPPVIGIVGSDLSDPFILPFTVRNKSRWFTMINATPFCIVRKLSLRGHNTISNSTIELTHRTILPTIGNFTCRIKVPSAIVERAQIFISFTYETHFLRS